MLLVGLTGGIGAGKSSVAALLAERGAVILDADQVARDVVEPDQPAFAALVERFGPEIVGADGRLDRAKLAELAFASDTGTADLNAIVHPAVGREFLARMKAAPAEAIVVCDVPLLVESETARSRGYEYVIVVEAPLEIRLERLEERGVPRDDAKARIAQQASDDERRAIATHLVDNAGDRAQLEAQVDAIWQDLLRLHAEKPAPPDDDGADPE
jgi:dephospho-CoA kinase